MSKLLFLSLALATLASCSYKIFVNNKLYHKEKDVKEYSILPDSIFVLRAEDSLPSGAAFISRVRVEEPFTKLSGYNTMLSYVLEEARKKGANVIKVISNWSDRNLYKNNKIDCSLFSLKEPYLSSYLRKVDSANSILKNSNYCVVHIKNVCLTKYGPCNIYYNDSLIGKALGSTMEKKQLQSVTLDIKLPGGGILSPYPNVKYYGLQLTNGKEYYVHVWLGGNLNDVMLSSLESITNKEYGHFVFKFLRRDEY